MRRLEFRSDKSLSLAGLLAVCLLGGPAFATVDIETTLRDIYYRGTCERAGSMTFRVEGDDFFEPFQDKPCFIRVKLDKGARLCETLVDIRGPGKPHRPLYLAMKVEGNGTRFLNASWDSVAIVRWRAGEDQIWLRIATSSSTWIKTADGETYPPNRDFTVSWEFAVSATQNRANFYEA